MRWFLLLLVFLLTACSDTEVCSDAAFYSDGTIKERICIVPQTGDTLRIESFHQNGALQAIKTFEHQQRVGVWKSYYDNGNLWSEHHYASGKLHGPYFVWYENGKPRISGQYENGRKIGNWKFYNEQGELIKEEVLSK